MGGDLTILVFAFRKSEIHEWLRRHRGARFDSVRIVCAYRLDDVDSDRAVEQFCTMFQGTYSGLARIQQCLALVDTPYILLAAGDDQIVSIPEDVGECLPTRIAIAGNAFFQAGSRVHPSSNNSLILTDTPADLVQRYWTLPNPGDNCLFYSIFPVETFKQIVAATGEYEGSDWYFVHRFLLSCPFSRNPSLVISRQLPPQENHYTRRFLERLSLAGLDKAAWPFHNPLLRAFRNIYEVTPSSMVSLLQPRWATWLRMKYDEMARADEEYRDLIKSADVAQVSSEMASRLGTITESQLPPPC